MVNSLISSRSAETTIYTAITFAPVQGFIEQSRKLRDLYGSSYILSYLADSVCNAAIDAARRQGITATAENPSYPVISPASLKIARGTPNKIIIAGEFPKDLARVTFDKAWSDIVNTSQQWLDNWIETELHIQPLWDREWSLWRQHTWELFWATGASIQDAIAALNASKQSRNWVGVNWVGESSTLSGADAAAYPSMSLSNPKTTSQSIEDTKIKTFYQQLSEKLPEAIIDARESLSIPELIKRLITVNEIPSVLTQPETPRSFKQVNRWQEDNVKEVKRKEDKSKEPGCWTGWFKGDGDCVSDYLKSLLNSIAQQQNIDEKSHEAQHLYAQEIYQFSKQMRTWGEALSNQLPKADKPRRSLDYDGRIVYAGGDDFLGILYRNPPDSILLASECIDWFCKFKPDIWSQHQQPITVSVGFVWVAPNVPQRDVLQHCREAEKAAKDSGRDRIAIRILFNGGNTLEWTCPWWFLDVFTDYRDRNQVQGITANWNHLFEDVATLEARHAFRGNTNVALALFELYFGVAKAKFLQNEEQYWNRSGHTGILGDSDRFPTPKAKQKALNGWVINLAKVGFHLHREKPETTHSNELGNHNNPQPDVA
jgi:CRISPR-associated protein Cmr2